MKYIIAGAAALSDLEVIVNARIGDGYVPHGPLVVDRWQWESERDGLVREVNYLQPMVCCS